MTRPPCLLASKANIDSSGGKVFLFSLCEMILKNGCLRKPDITRREHPSTVSEQNHKYVKDEIPSELKEGREKYSIEHRMP